MKIGREISKLKEINSDRGYIYWGESVKLKGGLFLYLFSPEIFIFRGNNIYNFYTKKGLFLTRPVYGKFVAPSETCVAMVNYVDSFLLDESGYKYNLDLKKGVFFGGEYTNTR